MIPNLPTDSLYKFLALSSIIAILAGFYFMNHHTTELVDKRLDLTYEVEKLELKIARFLERHEEVKGVRDFSLEEKEQLEKTRKYLESKELTPDEFIGQLNVILDQTLKYDLDLARINLLSAKQNQLERVFNLVKWVNIAWVSFWSGMCFWSFRLWYHRIQKPLDQAMERGDFFSPPNS
ncbi:hypothetical protein AB4345_05270 [Vibrio breoganii]